MSMPVTAELLLDLSVTELTYEVPSSTSADLRFKHESRPRALHIFNAVTDSAKGMGRTALIQDHLYLYTSSKQGEDYKSSLTEHVIPALNLSAGDLKSFATLRHAFEALFQLGSELRLKNKIFEVKVLGATTAIAFPQKTFTLIHMAESNGTLERYCVAQLLLNPLKTICIVRGNVKSELLGAITPSLTGLSYPKVWIKEDGTYFTSIEEAFAEIFGVS